MQQSLFFGGSLLRVARSLSSLTTQCLRHHQLSQEPDGVPATKKDLCFFSDCELSKTESDHVVRKLTTKAFSQKLLCLSAKPGVELRVKKFWQSDRTWTRERIPKQP